MCHARNLQGLADLLSGQITQADDGAMLLIETVDCRARRSASMALTALTTAWIGRNLGGGDIPEPWST